MQRWWQFSWLRVTINPIQRTTNMEKETPRAESAPFRLNVKRTMLIGFAFFGILLMWQIYDSWCPTFLTELFCKAMGKVPTEDNSDVQYLVGIMMALDNLAALILMPIFGKLSDRTHTKIGKRMPFILIGTFLCAVALPFIPLLFYFNQLGGMIAVMAIVLISGMMYRNPAVALMPDITPKPLRSKANGIINIMGYVGGFVATLLGMIFVLSDFLRPGPEGATWAYQNIWAIEAPFLVASLFMIVSALVLFFSINENRLAVELREELDRGEKVAEIEDRITDDDAPLTKANLRMLIFILVAEFFWFMADNAIGTFMGNFAIYYLGCSSRNSMINTIAGGVGSVLGFALGGIIAGKIGRKWTVSGGLFLSIFSYALWAILTFAIPSAGSGVFPPYIYAIFLLKGFGMSLVHINSFPMVVELCSKKKIGAFTGYYYAASMGAQTITPIALGSLMLIPEFSWEILPIYGLVMTVVAAAIFLFVKNVKTSKTKIAKGLEAFGEEE
ncbi:MAG: MFS transporter [Candidatus Enteromonas sp.]|nr:MFS transporter [Candidatus Enteromonas sp.]